MTFRDSARLTSCNNSSPATCCHLCKRKCTFLRFFVNYICNGPLLATDPTASKLRSQGCTPRDDCEPDISSQGQPLTPITMRIQGRIIQRSGVPSLLSEFLFHYKCGLTAGMAYRALQKKSWHFCVLPTAPTLPTLPTPTLLTLTCITYTYITCTIASSWCHALVKLPALLVLVMECTSLHDACQQVITVL